MHWASKYCHLIYKEGGRDMTGVDCWGLLRLIYKDRFQIELPEFPGICMAGALTINSTVESVVGDDWIEITTPFDGCAVGMSQKKAIHHVGLFIKANGGKILHCWERQNVIVDTARSLQLKGFRVLKFYQHRSWNMPLL